ncbi:MAG: hypothetical protein Q9191_003920 [Dirinaria sp. TL-2023a]
MTVSTGIKIGLTGLFEREWLPTVNQLPPDLTYRSASAVALEMIPDLKKQGAELMIALTHRREPDDIKLAKKTGGLIDSILAGYDHFYKHDVVMAPTLRLSYLELLKPLFLFKRRCDIRVIREDISESIPEGLAASQWVEALALSLRPKLDQPMGYSAVEIDARFTTVRREETKMGSFNADATRLYYRADCSIMAAGIIRGDCVYLSGLLTMKDIRSWYGKLNCFVRKTQYLTLLS